jgi:hypothetical protein
MAEEISVCRRLISELRAIHHHAAAANFAVANKFAFFMDYGRAADGTDDVAVALARNFRTRGLRRNIDGVL